MFQLVFPTMPIPNEEVPALLEEGNVFHYGHQLLKKLGAMGHLGNLDQWKVNMLDVKLLWPWLEKSYLVLPYGSAIWLGFVAGFSVGKATDPDE